MPGGRPGCNLRKHQTTCLIQIHSCPLQTAICPSFPCLQCLHTLSCSVARFLKASSPSATACSLCLPNRCCPCARTLTCLSIPCLLPLHTLLSAHTFIGGHCVGGVPGDCEREQAFGAGKAGLSLFSCQRHRPLALSYCNLRHRRYCVPWSVAVLDWEKGTF